GAEAAPCGRVPKPRVGRTPGKLAQNPRRDRALARELARAARRPLVRVLEPRSPAEAFRRTPAAAPQALTELDTRTSLRTPWAKRSIRGRPHRSGENLTRRGQDLLSGRTCDLRRMHAGAAGLRRRADRESHLRVQAPVRPRRDPSAEQSRAIRVERRF